MDTVFPIVGIGASAGGIEAIGDLLSAMPADTGMAFLVVLHLDPTHRSMLSEILTRKTRLPAIEAVDGQEIEADHIYTIAPNTVMRVAQRRISLSPRVDTAGTPMPIDDLFESLAEDARGGAIGVVLSGSGADGALGLRAIKAAGGTTFAQDESARFGAMPRAAVELGCVDQVLPPNAIASELARIARHPLAIPPAMPESAASEADEIDLQRVFQLLRGFCDVDFAHYKRGTMTRRIKRRLLLHQMTTLADYVRLLESDPAEGAALCRDFLINVTRFFRDAESFDDLATMVWPRLFAGGPARAPVRIWVPGCASGEEVYSIAISALEYLETRAADTRLQIFGTDVSDASIDAARSGRYLESIARDVSPERLQRWFVKRDSHYQLVKAVRDLCIFSRHDVTRDPPFSRVDLISCRNLLIYLAPQAQQRLMPIFHYALNPNGCLTLGPAESIGMSSELFRLLDGTSSRIYVRRAAPGRAQPELPGPARRGAGRAVAANDVPPTEFELLQREADRVAQTRYVPAGVLCDDALNVLQFRGDTGPYLLQPAGPPTVSLQRLARPGLLVEMGAAIQQVRTDGVPARRTGVRIDGPHGLCEVNLEVMPVQASAAVQCWFLIFFEPATAAPQAAAQRTPPSPWARLSARLRGVPAYGRAQAEREREIGRLQQELQAERDYVRSIIDKQHVALEELRSTQEELLSSNEEFQSTNEELDTAKEELQSTNEELSTTNDELRNRNIELLDLTGRLQEARDYADAIVETAREPMLILDSGLRVVRVNQSFCAAFNVTREESECARFDELGNGQWDIPELRQLLEKSLVENGSFQDYEVAHVFPGIGYRAMRLNAKRLDWPEHHLILLAIEDVTAREAVLRELRDGEQHKNEFLAMLGHELRNPLAAMRNALRICERSEADHEARREALAMMSRQLDKETRLVDDLLDLSRVTHGTIALAMTPVDLVPVVARAVEEMRHAMDARGHVLTLALPTDSLCVNGDAARLEQVVANLLGNSAKFTGPGGRIDVTLERIGERARLVVADNGIGIASDMLPTIFDLFVQAKGASDRANGGLGLGLTLARRIIELHGGTVVVESRGLKLGTTLIVSLPALPASTAAAEAPGTAAPAPPMVAPSRILVVDDNADMAAGTAVLLRMHGHDVRTAGEGPAAIEIARTFKPRVVVLDIGLPGMDGHELARRLRAMPELDGALLIALSGYGQAEDMQRSLAAGIDHHLVKPAEFDRIIGLIAAHQCAAASVDA